MNHTTTYPLPSSSSLEVGRLSRIFDNMSECYKLFWFQAILTKTCEGREQFIFEELIDQMIVDAWYMVSEYKLNLGPADTLEALVHYVYENSGIKSNEKKNCRSSWTTAVPGGFILPMQTAKTSAKN